ncbi:MAG: Gfo/Idh/MocA family oxidoreductase [Thermoproteota archaeon]
MADKLGVCVLGCGFIGAVHAERWRSIPEVELATCFSRSEDKAMLFKEKYGFKKASKNPVEAIQDKDVSIVDICTPTYTHRDFALQSLDAGKHVLLEKPIALRLSDAREIVRKAEKNGLKLMVAHVLRFWGEYLASRELILQGEIGEPVLARAYRQSAFPSWTSDLWHHDLHKSGGVFVDLSIHDVDFLRWCIGEVEEVYAQGGNYLGKNASSPDYVQALLKFKSGALGYVEGSWIMPDGFPLTSFIEVSGTRGILSVDNKSTATLSIYRPGGLREELTPLFKDGYYLEIRCFVDSILRSEPPPVPGEEGLKSLEVVLAGLKSIFTGKPVKLPLGEEVL